MSVVLDELNGSQMKGQDNRQVKRACLKSPFCICSASAGGELWNLFLCPQIEKPSGEDKLRIFLMHKGQADESIEVAEEEADMVIEAVIFFRSQAGGDSLIGEYI